MALIAQTPLSFNGRSSTATADLLRSSRSGIFGTPLEIVLGKGRLGIGMKSNRNFNFTVSAKIRKMRKHEYPWPKKPDPNVKGGILTHLSPFKPLKDPPKPARMRFEKPLVELEKRIEKAKKLSDAVGLKIDELTKLEKKYQKALTAIYSNLKPIHRVNIARHPNRPTFLDHIFNITEKFVELHGDRAGYDDPAIVTGIGTIDGKSYLFIGQQKGRNTKENIKRNFGMPTPHGYRKALRMMHYADHHGFPIITFIDTPGAFADLKSEYLGQGEAIAMNLRTMFGLKVPIVSIVLGEGGSGGALAIGCANKLLMLENSVFFVASPEACAAIIWKSAKAAPKAAKKLRITARELVKQGIADEVIPEPLGGAHRGPSYTSQRIKVAITEAMDELSKMNTEELLRHRYLKFRQMGKVGHERKRIPIVIKEDIKKVKMDFDLEYSKAVEAIGFKDNIAMLRQEFSKANSPEERTALLAKIEKLENEINQSLPAAPNYPILKKKFEKFSDLSRTQKASKMKRKILLKIKEILDGKAGKMLIVVKNLLKKSRVKKAQDVDPELRKTYVQVINLVASKVVGVLKPFCLFDDRTIRAKAEYLTKKIHTKRFKVAIDEVIEDINKEYDIAINNAPQLQHLIQVQKLEVMKAGKNPSSESKMRIEALEQQIQESIRKAFSSSKFEEKDKLLKDFKSVLNNSPELQDMFFGLESKTRTELLAQLIQIMQKTPSVGSKRRTELVEKLIKESVPVAKRNLGAIRAYA